MGAEFDRVIASIHTAKPREPHRSAIQDRKVGHGNGKLESSGREHSAEYG